LAAAAFTYKLIEAYGYMRGPGTSPYNAVSDYSRPRNLIVPHQRTVKNALELALVRR